jgi:hypothetical protein
MSAPSLFDICIKAVCLHAHSDLLSIEEEDFPTEVRNNLLSFVLTRGLLTPRVCKQFMKDYFTVFTLGMSPLANDEVIGIVGASCPNLVKLEGSLAFLFGLPFTCVNHTVHVTNSVRACNVE